MSLTPEQRHELRRLLALELRDALRTARAGGASEAVLAGLVDERRRAMRAAGGTAEDRSGGDDPVGRQRPGDED